MVPHSQGFTLSVGAETRGAGSTGWPHNRKPGAPDQRLDVFDRCCKYGSVKAQVQMYVVSVGDKTPKYRAGSVLYGSHTFEAIRLNIGLKCAGYCRIVGHVPAAESGVGFTLVKPTASGFGRSIRGAETVDMPGETLGSEEAGHFGSAHKVSGVGADGVESGRRLPAQTNPRAFGGWMARVGKRAVA